MAEKIMYLTALVNIGADIKAGDVFNGAVLKNKVQLFLDLKHVKKATVEEIKEVKQDG